MNVEIFIFIITIILNKICWFLFKANKINIYFYFDLRNTRAQSCYFINIIQLSIFERQGIEQRGYT